MLLAHILEMSLSSLEHSDAEVVQMCMLHPFPSEELLERILSADYVISGLGRDTNHLKERERFYKEKSTVTLLWPWKMGAVLSFCE